MKIVTTVLPDRYIGIQQVCLKLLDSNFIFWEPEKKPVNDMLEDIDPDIIFIDLKYINTELIDASNKTRAKIVLFGNGVPSGLKVNTVCTMPNVSSVVRKYLDNGEHEVLYIKDYADICTVFNGEYDPQLACDIGYISHDKDPDKLMKKLEIFSGLTKYSVKIVGDVKIPIPKFLGGIRTNRISSFMKSCKILVDYDGDIMLNAAANGVFALSTVVNGLYPILDTSNLVKFLESDNNLREKIAKNRQKLILESDTCYHRFADIMASLNEEELVIQSKEALKCAVA